MDFNLDETQQEVASLARRILEDHVDHRRLKLIEAGEEWFDRDVWRQLASAGLVGLALAEDVGGAGMGMVELGQVLEAQGRFVAPIPLVPTLSAALAVDRFGTADQRQRWLPGVCEGTTVLSTALQEYLNDDVLAPTTDATVSGTSYSLTGTKVMVEYAEQADRILVGGSTGDGVTAFLVDPRAGGVTLVKGITSRREPVHELHLEAAPGEVLGEPGAGREVLEWVRQRVLGMLCSIQVGVAGAQLAATAAYTSEREQFGRPIATFQAVTQRLANAYIDVEAIRLCTYSAMWRLANGLDAREDLEVAKWFASDGAHHVAHGAQHMHGGAGVDVENPLHRYTLWSKHLECSLGAGTASLRRLGARLAAT